mmetsp:Transcript_8154/g.15912  ORF Transcript_8154/g.15912 Transcript_8154/m.15912 type:complete len:135 (-) Transcript_8154:752-1156(-)
MRKQCWPVTSLSQGLYVCLTVAHDNDDKRQRGEVYQDKGKTRGVAQSIKFILSVGGKGGRKSNGMNSASYRHDKIRLYHLDRATCFCFVDPPVACSCFIHPKHKKQKRLHAFLVLFAWRERHHVVGGISTKPSA